MSESASELLKLKCHILLASRKWESARMEEPRGLRGISSVQYSVMSDSSWPHGLQGTRPPCPSPTPGVYSNSCPLSRWFHPTISSSVIPFSSCLQSFPASGCFAMSQLFTSGGQSIGDSSSTSVFPVNTQDWYPLGWTSWISLQSKGLSRLFSNTKVQKRHWCIEQSYGLWERGRGWEDLGEWHWNV